MDITKLLNNNQVIFELKNQAKEEVIKEMVELLDDNGRLNSKQGFLNAVLEREKVFTTGISNGIAIPHGKSNSVKEASIVFARSEIGIEYNSTDGLPIYLLFLIAVPEDANNDHLKILSYLSRKLMHKEVREALITAQNYKEIINILDS